MKTFLFSFGLFVAAFAFCPAVTVQASVSEQAASLQAEEAFLLVTLPGDRAREAKQLKMLQHSDLVAGIDHQTFVVRVATGTPESLQAAEDEILQQFPNADTRQVTEAEFQEMIQKMRSGL